MDLANPGFMNQAAQLTNIGPSVQQAVLGQQSIQQNQNALATQQRQQLAQQALGVATDPNADPAARQQAMQVVQTNDPQTAMALRLQMQGQQALQSLIKNPSAAAASQAIMLNPTIREALTSGWGTMSDAAIKSKVSAAGDVIGYLSGPNPDLKAVDNLLQQHEQADRNAGLPVESYQALHAMLQSGNINGALATAHLIVAGANPEKIGENYKDIASGETTAATRPSDVAKAAADASTATTTAQYAPQVQQSNLDTAASQRAVNAQTIANGIIDNQVKQGTLALDVNKLAADTNIRMAEIDQKYGVIPPESLKIVNDASGQAAASQQTADREKALAAQIRSAGLTWGPAASAAEWLKQKTGSQDEYTQLRSQYMQLKNQGMLANAKGVFNRITNSELKLMNQGFPPPNANPGYLASFLETMAKVTEGVAQQNDDKATWAASNGPSGLGPARKPMVIDGMRVPAGMTFMQHQKLRGQIAAPALPDDAQAVVKRAQGK